MARDPADPEDMQVEQRERMALVGELLSDASHEFNNQLAFVLSNLQNLAEYGDELARVVGAYRERLVAAGVRDPALQRLETEVDLDFLLEDAGRAAREGLAGATRVRDVLKVLARIGEDEATDRPLIDIARAVKQVLGVEAKAISLRAELQVEADLDVSVAAPPALLTRAMVVIVKDALGAFDARERERNVLSVKVQRRGGSIAVVFERRGGKPQGRGLSLAQRAADAMGAQLIVEPGTTTLLIAQA